MEPRSLVESKYFMAVYGVLYAILVGITRTPKLFVEC